MRSYLQRRFFRLTTRYGKDILLPSTLLERSRQLETPDHYVIDYEAHIVGSLYISPAVTREMSCCGLFMM